VDSRFKQLSNFIRWAVADQDAFALRGFHTLTFDPTVGPGQFASGSSAASVAAFSTWLQDLVDKGILEITEGEPFGVAPWQHIYIESAYKKGLSAGFTSLRAAKAVPDAAISTDPAFSIAAAFNAPIHADRVGIAFTTAGSAMKGVTDAMVAQIRHIVALGLAEGRGPEALAQQIIKTVEDIGRNRARAVARTETIRAHHLANIATFKEAGLAGVTVRAEWATADDGVCPDCAWMNGRLFTIAEIESLIPLHPNCRCVALPADVGEDPDDRDGYDPSTISSQYRRRDGSLKFRNFYRKKTGNAISALPGRE
jgi:SPP1 gp7 family putative phage head morphogenesis protein